MARPPKVSIDYAGWSVNLFDNDPKMDKLLDAQGWCGFGVYFFLCQRAYGSDGYFYKWCYDDCATTARKMGGGIGAGTVKEAVDYCLRIGLFDEGLFVRWGVLTSRGIQKRYIDAIRKRDVKEVIAEYWLLHESEECEGLLKLPINTDLSEVNTDSRTGNRNFRTGNPSFRAKSKVKESKVNNTIPVSKDTVCRTDVQRVVDAWNAIPGVIQISRISVESNRYKLLLGRIRKYGIDDVLKAVDSIADSKFLLGGNKKSWMIDFEWFVKPNNFPKVLEGKYLDRQRDVPEKYSAIDEFLKKAGDKK